MNFRAISYWRPAGWQQFTIHRIRTASPSLRCRQKLLTKTIF
jgi:hypothetical protein